MLSKRDTVILIFFLLSVYLLHRWCLSRESENNEGGGLAALTTTSKLLVTDDNGNLSTYTPASEGFVTNELKVVNGTTTNFTCNNTGTTVTGPISATGEVSASAGKFSGEVSGTAGKFSGEVSGTAGKFSGEVSGTAGKFSGDVSGRSGIFSGTALLNGGAALNNRRLYIGADGDTGRMLTSTTGDVVELRAKNGGKLTTGLDSSNPNDATIVTWNDNGLAIPINKQLRIGNWIFEDTGGTDLKLYRANVNAQNYFSFRMGTSANANMDIYKSNGVDDHWIGYGWASTLGNDKSTFKVRM